MLILSPDQTIRHANIVALALDQFSSVKNNDLARIDRVSEILPKWLFRNLPSYLQTHNSTFAVVDPIAEVTGHGSTFIKIWHAVTAVL